MITMMPLHFFSVEHLKLQGKFGKKRGIRIGEILGLISGWGFFLFWIGIWISPQPRFMLPFLQSLVVSVRLVNFSIPIFHLALSFPLIMLGSWFGIKGAKETTLKVAETHRTEKIVSTGTYSIVRHPQYLGGLLAHAGISLLFSALYSLIFTPVIVIIIYLISRKEEEELIREFNELYQDYKRKVPMLIPRCARSTFSLARERVV